MVRTRTRAMSSPPPSTSTKRTTNTDTTPMTQHWFDGARFGMFVHWTHIANRGFELSWPMVGGVAVLPYSRDVSVDDYYSRALDFCPQTNAPREWMRLARA